MKHLPPLLVLLILCFSAFLANASPTTLETYIKIHPGTFTMGCLKGRDVINQPDVKCPVNELSAVDISVGGFFISKYEVTNAEWQKCVEANICDDVKQISERKSIQSLPVMNVSPKQVITYIAWLNKTTRQVHRLPSEIEWEFAARGGVNGTSHPWLLSENEMGTVAELADCQKARFVYYSKSCPRYNYDAKPVGNFPENNYGLYDMAGNAHELVSECPYRGSLTGPDVKNQCNDTQFRIKGGGVYSHASELRSASRSKLISITNVSRFETHQGDSQMNSFPGFRLVREE